MSVTIEQQRQRVEQEMTKNVDDLDRSFLRKMQVNEPIPVVQSYLRLWFCRLYGKSVTNNRVDQSEILEV